ncbi:hypothetical protein [Subtercola boreus]|uniref:hypothetical protein n=1 Tax=Subtercola boreus TaxID=120213 RepID=UPI0011C0267D|nr:hypothetical protein [Subtercola boreus]
MRFRILLLKLHQGLPLDRQHNQYHGKNRYSRRNYPGAPNQASRGVATSNGDQERTRKKDQKPKKLGPTSNSKH